MALVQTTAPMVSAVTSRDPIIDRADGWSRRHLGRVLGVVLALLLLSLALRHIDPKRALSLVLSLGPTATLLALPSILAVSCETFAWQSAISRMARPVRFLSLLRVRVASESLASVLPMGALWADAARPPLLARHCRLSVGEGIASVAVRKYLLVSSQAGYLLLAFFVGRTVLEDGFRRAAGAPALCAVALVGAAILLTVAEGSALAFRGGTLLQSLLTRLSRLPWDSLRRRLTTLRDGTRRTDRAAASFFRMGSLHRLLASAPCLLGWLLEATETWVFLVALGARLSWGDALAVEAVVVLGRHLLVFLPGGLGIVELGYATFFVGSGASVDLCAAFVLLKRSREVAWAAVGYVLWTLDRAVT